MKNKDIIFVAHKHPELPPTLAGFGEWFKRSSGPKAQRGNSMTKKKALMMRAKKPIIMTKLLKNVDKDIWRQFRAYCIVNEITMGEAISALQQCVIEGHITMEIPDTDEIRVYKT